MNRRIVFVMMICGATLIGTALFLAWHAVKARAPGGVTVVVSSDQELALDMTILAIILALGIVNMVMANKVLYLK